MKKRKISSMDELDAANLISKNSESRSKLQQVSRQYAVAITDHMVEEIAKSAQDLGLVRQFVPSIKELNVSVHESSDPIGDDEWSPIKGLVHRYPDRCLLKPVQVCPVYCRFCFRREQVGPGNSSLTQDELLACYAYIAEHTEIWEVILTGGDPLIMKPKQLQKIISSLDHIPHVEIIRIHTRVPIVDPNRINTEMLQALTVRKPVYIILHCNHSQEFSVKAEQAIGALVDSGIPVLGQTVLLKDINNTVEIMGKLLRKMVKNRIKPYYLHHADLARGTKHFRTSIAEGQNIMAALRGSYSGLCLPTYVLDLPGGNGKSPIGPNYISYTDEQQYAIKNYQGDTYCYKEDC